MLALLMMLLGTCDYAASISCSAIRNDCVHGGTLNVAIQFIR